jgi:hypothetical protein
MKMGVECHRLRSSRYMEWKMMDMARFGRESIELDNECLKKFV